MLYFLFSILLLCYFIVGLTIVALIVAPLLVYLSSVIRNQLFKASLMLIPKSSIEFLSTKTVKAQNFLNNARWKWKER